MNDREAIEMFCLLLEAELAFWRLPDPPKETLRLLGWGRAWLEWSRHDATAPELKQALADEVELWGVEDNEWLSKYSYSI